MHQFYILVLDKNAHSQVWLVTASSPTEPPLLALPSHHDQIVMQLPKALYPGVQTSTRQILNAHTNQMEGATIYGVDHV